MNPCRPSVPPFGTFHPFRLDLRRQACASKKTKIAQSLSAVGYKAVLPELIFFRQGKKLKRMLDVFARVLTRHGRNPTCQSRHGSSPVRLGWRDLNPCRPSVPLFGTFHPFRLVLHRQACAAKKQKLLKRMSAVGYKAVLPELIFFRQGKKLKRMLDAFARVLTRNERKSAGQNRHGFKSRQPKKMPDQKYKSGILTFILSAVHIHGELKRGSQRNCISRQTKVSKDTCLPYRGTEQQYFYPHFRDVLQARPPHKVLRPKKCRPAHPRSCR